MQLSTLPMSLLLFLPFFPVASTTTPPATGGSSTTSSPTSTSASSASGNTTSSVATVTSSAMFPSLSGYSSCVTNCLAVSASQANCTTVVDVNCFCSSTNNKKFTTAMISCISGSCPSELTTAENLSQQFCAVSSNSTSLSYSVTSIASSSNSSSAGASATSPTPSSTAPQSASQSASANAAVWGGGAGFSGAALTGMLVVWMSVVLGALCI